MRCYIKTQKKTAWNSVDCVFKFKTQYLAIVQTGKQIIPLHDEIREREENSDGFHQISKSEIIDNLNCLISKKNQSEDAGSEEYVRVAERFIQIINEKTRLKFVLVKDVKQMLKDNGISFQKKIPRVICNDLETYYHYTFNNSARQSNPYTLFPGFKGMGLVNIYGKYHYYVGGINNVKQKIPRAIRLRKITPLTGDEKIIFELIDGLTDMMNVEFVRNGQYTVVPYPLKYIREFRELKNKKIEFKKKRYSTVV